MGRKWVLEHKYAILLRLVRWYVFCLMSHSTYVNLLFSKSKWYVLNWYQYLIPLTCLYFLSFEWDILEPNPKSFTSKTELQSHNENFHWCIKKKAPKVPMPPRHRFDNIGEMKCGICDSTFENRIIYDAHMIQEHGVNPYDCLICPDATFPTHYQLRKHQKEFHGENMTKEIKTEWPCDIPGCKYVGKTRRNLYSHKRNHVITEKPWKCDQCDYSCKLKANLLIHQEMVKQIYRQSQDT